ncbi:MAG TPA: IS1 family transposase [Candidatus Binatia bacterium]|nr:IS1 family transposase [Candidatus Binatia bacterium]
MNKLPAGKRAQILSMLVEGSSMRSISRVVDVSINTVDRYLILAGEACAAFHDRTVRNVRAQRVQCDEIWSFCGMKEKAAKAKGSERPEGVGDVWTWTAIDADHKLIIAWLVGGRDAGYAYEFMLDVAGRLANRVQLTTDGHGAYLATVPDAFGFDVDFAQLVKVYGPDPREDQRRYSPAQCLGAEKHRVIGHPDPEHISTSYVERSNLTLRMANRRFTRLTNAFSKKLANHCHMIALYTVWYNFVKMHKAVRMTPALAANVTDRLWSMDDLVALVDEHDAARPRQKPGRKPKAAAAGESN